MNVFMLVLMWLGHMLPDATGVSGATTTFEQVYALAREAAARAEAERAMKPNVVASMVAYLVAQSIDVQLFHFWRQLTDGRHLWLRFGNRTQLPAPIRSNNGSTMLSQLVDTALILSILYAAGSLGEDVDFPSPSLFPWRCHLTQLDRRLW